MSKQQYNFTLSSTMENNPAFIGLGWIEMVEKFEDEVEGRSQKEGSRVQVSLGGRDEVSMKLLFEKFREDLSFSLFTKGTASPPL